MKKGHFFGSDPKPAEKVNPEGHVASELRHAGTTENPVPLAPVRAPENEPLEKGGSALHNQIEELEC